MELGAVYSWSCAVQPFCHCSLLLKKLQFETVKILLPKERTKGGLSLLCSQFSNGPMPILKFYQWAFGSSDCRGQLDSDFDGQYDHQVGRVRRMWSLAVATCYCGFIHMKHHETYVWYCLVSLNIYLSCINASAKDSWRQITLGCMQSHCTVPVTYKHKDQAVSLSLSDYVSLCMHLCNDACMYIYTVCVYRYVCHFSHTHMTCVYI